MLKKAAGNLLSSTPNHFNNYSAINQKIYSQKYKTKETTKQLSLQTSFDASFCIKKEEYGWILHRYY